MKMSAASFNVEAPVANYLCPCRLHSSSLDTEVVVEVSNKVQQCLACGFPWAIFSPHPLLKCVSCASSRCELVPLVTGTACVTCGFCQARIGHAAIMSHYERLVTQSVRRPEDGLSAIEVAPARPVDKATPRCGEHDWHYRFTGGVFEQVCRQCDTRREVTDSQEILASASLYMNCCDEPRTRLSAFKYLDKIVLQCKTCLAESAVPQSSTIENWLSVGTWGLGFVEEQVMSVRDLAVGDHLAYMRSLYEHHVIVVSTSPREGRFQQIGFTIPSRPATDDKRKDGPGARLEGRIELLDIQFSRIEEPLVIISYLPLDCFPVGQVVQRAFSRVWEANYNLLSNNCEHIASWCKFGRYECAQVKKLVDKYSRLGRGIISEHVLTTARSIYNSVERAATDDSTIANIQNAVGTQHQQIRRKLRNTFGFIRGER